MSKRISKGLVVNGSTLVTEAAWNAELDAKHEKVVEWLRTNKLSGILLKRHENVAWLTGGAVEVRVLTPGETGVASVLVTAAGKRYYFTTENEAPRLHDEEFGALDFEPILFPWHADDTVAAAARLAGTPGPRPAAASSMAAMIYNAPARDMMHLPPACPAPLPCRRLSARALRASRARRQRRQQGGSSSRRYGAGRSGPDTAAPDGQVSGGRSRPGRGPGGRTGLV